MLNDLCPKYKAEVYVIVSALKKHIVTDLLSPPYGLPMASVHDRLAQRLENELAMRSEEAHWAVNVWSQILKEQRQNLHLDKWSFKYFNDSLPKGHGFVFELMSEYYWLSLKKLWDICYQKHNDCLSFFVLGLFI